MPKTLRCRFRQVTLVLLASLLLAGNGAAADRIERTGDALQIFLPTAALVSTLFVDDFERQGDFYKSFIATAGITHGLKYSIDKQRPTSRDTNSFPSGHTSAAFQGAAYIHRRHGLGYGLPAYAGAAFVGYSRVHAGKHFVEDVLAGAALGIGASFFFTRSRHGVVVTPSAGDGSFDINVNLEF